MQMDWREQYNFWVQQVEKLRASMESLTHTDPKNIIQHFFLQAIQHEFSRELESHKTTIKTIICTAVELSNTLEGTSRERAVKVLHHLFGCQEPLLTSIRLSDIRNRAVFEVYKQCGLTVNTYFNRYSSPPGTEEQNSAYLAIAHGNACASAVQTVILSQLLLHMQILKRFFVVYDCIVHNGEHSPTNLNWIGAMWAHHIETNSLDDLVWHLFLDVWLYETL
jgi:hypothetical protein